MKKLFIILPLALILCFMVGCQDKDARVELEAMKAQAEVEEQNEELIRNYFKELDKGNSEILREVYAPDAAYYFPSGITEPMTVDQEIEQFKMFHNAIPDLVHNIEEIISVGDKVIVRFIARGTHTGEIEGMGIQATGNEVEVSSIVIFRVENGKVVEERQEADMLGFMQQFGLQLMPEENIQISHIRGTIGHNITVKVTARGDERIRRVRTVFDGRRIGNDFLTPPQIWYRREFTQQGGHDPGRTHKVIVTVTSTIGTETASLIWTD